MVRVVGSLSYQPFIDGPGRRNDYVKLEGKNIYQITHVEEFFSPPIGLNVTVAPNFWQVDAEGQLAVRGDTGFLNLAITNITTHRLLQITGIELWTAAMEISLRQPAKMIRWGAGDVAEGTLSAVRSPIAAPIRLRNLFTVNEKPLQMRALSTSRCVRIRPRVSMRGFLYELVEGPKQVAHYYEPPIGGIE